jgi:hypothetical protein
VRDDRPTLDELDELIEAIVHELNGLQVRRRSIAELAPHDQNRILQMLKPFLGLVTGVRERIDDRLTKILEQRLDS